MRIILDKSVVYGLSRQEVDALDQYFLQIVPPILSNEILADLTKEESDAKAIKRIAANSYRISGSSEISESYFPLLVNSLLGNEVSMDGRSVPLGQQTFQTKDGKVGLVISAMEQEQEIARWERQEFTPYERHWAREFRAHTSQRIDTDNYLKKIADSGIQFVKPTKDADLGGVTDSLIENPKLQGKLLYFLFRDNFIPYKTQIAILNRWNAARKPMIRDFAPYAFYCARVNVLWAVAHSNSGLFAQNNNDRKDREYCYYLPFGEIFASEDRKYARLVPILMRPDQSFVSSVEFKADLNDLYNRWSGMSKQERIDYKDERGNAPPENEESVIFRLWKKHRGTIRKSLPLEIGQMKLYDSSLPKDQQVTFTLQDMLKQKEKELLAARPVSDVELQGLSGKFVEEKSPTMAIRRSLMSKQRLLNLYPHLTEADLDRK